MAQLEHLTPMGLLGTGDSPLTTLMEHLLEDLVEAVVVALVGEEEVVLLLLVAPMVLL